MTDTSLRFLYFTKKLINTHPVILLCSLLLIQSVLLIADQKILGNIVDNPVGLLIVALGMVALYGFGFFFIFSLAVVHIIPLGLPGRSSKRWQGVANKQGYRVKRRPSFKNIYELTHPNKNVRIVENIWFKNMLTGDDGSTFFLLYYYLLVAMPLFAIFSQSTTAEIEMDTRLPHIIFDNPASSIGGVKTLDLLSLQQDEVRLERADAKVYVQTGTELESYQLLDPAFLEVIENALTIFDIELCGSKVILRTDHLLSTKREQKLLLNTVDQIISLKSKLRKAKFPLAKTKPSMVFDDQALRVRFALKGFFILILTLSVYVLAELLALAL